MPQFSRQGVVWVVILLYCLLTRSCLLAPQICQELAGKQVWRLRSGRTVGVSDAAFLQADGGVDMGPAALAWLLRRAPLHEAAGSVKADLEAAGVTGLSSVTPATVRCSLMHDP